MNWPLQLDPTWPPSWQLSHLYDTLELGRDLVPNRRGYGQAWRNRQRRTVELVQAVAEPGARILDVAAAQGNMTLRLAEMGYEVTWNDLRADLADYVRLKWEKGNVCYVPGNVFEVSFPHLFDVVVATEIIEHVAHPDQFLAQLATLVRPGGHLVLTTPNGEYFLNRLPKFSECPDPSQFESMQFKPNSDGHIFLLHRSEVVDLAKEAGLEFLACRVFNNPLTCGHRKTERLLRLLPAAWVRALEQRSSRWQGPRGRRYHSHLDMLLRRPDTLVGNTQSPSSAA
jgi:2-polyprenyl-3-methyl-5-hydroxy-6-metoxy-1,4-benzoquinol methylase